MPSKIDSYKLPRKHDRRYRTSEKDVIKMKELYIAGISQKSIADIFGISQSAVSYAVSDRAKANLAEYRKNHPPKQRTKSQARDYARALRAYKKKIIQIDEES